MTRAHIEYSIQEASDKLGVGIDKLRRWDAQGMLVARRTEGGHRRYAREIIDGLAEAASARGHEPAEASGATQPALLRNQRIIELLLESEERYRDLVERALDLLWTADAQGRLTFVNGAAEALLGAKAQAVMGHTLFEFDPVQGAEANRRLLGALEQHGVVRHWLTRLIAADGTERWVGLSAELTRDARGGITGLRGSLRDVTEQYRATEQLEQLSLRDALTGLPNRLSLQRAVESALGAEQKGAVVFIDLDHFRYANDSLGYREADRLIRTIGGVLRECAQHHGGEVFRTGGDGFAVRLPGAMRSEATDIAEALLSRIRHFPLPADDEHRVLRLTASAGIAVYPFQGGDAAALLAAADIALHQAKDLGRNRAVVYGQGGGEALKATTQRVLWAKQLQQTVDQGRLALFVQPVVRLADGGVACQEVLVRLRDPEGNLVSPSQFLDPAESLGMIQRIDLWVTQKLVERLAAPGASTMKHFVNLSQVSISDPLWTRRFHALLQHAGPVRQQLVFEVSEAAALAEVSLTKGFIKDLRQLGCGFSLDDFGSGFSSFYHLRQFEVDFLKIHGSFAQDLASDRGNRVFVRALCDLGRSLSKQVIAKGIETPEALAAFASIGVEYGQGHLLQVPRPMEESWAEPAPDAQPAAGAL